MGVARRGVKSRSARLRGRGATWSRCRADAAQAVVTDRSAPDRVACRAGPFGPTGFGGPGRRSCGLSRCLGASRRLGGRRGGGLGRGDRARRRGRRRGRCLRRGRGHCRCCGGRRLGVAGRRGDAGAASDQADEHGAEDEGGDQALGGHRAAPGTPWRGISATGPGAPRMKEHRAVEARTVSSRGTGRMSSAAQTERPRRVTGPPSRSDVRGVSQRAACSRLSLPAVCAHPATRAGRSRAQA